jgi:multidrug efflux system outer membrane protein
LRYEGGYTSYIEVLDAERSLFNSQLTYTQTNGLVYQSVVALYKAMGGGWVVTAEELTHQDAAPQAVPHDQPQGSATGVKQSVAELPR